MIFTTENTDEERGGGVVKHIFSGNGTGIAFRVMPALGEQ